MRPSGRLNCVCLLPLFLALIIAACGPEEQRRAPAGSAAAAPAYGDIMVEGSIGDASNLIPLLSSDSTSHGIAGLIFNGLVKYDKDINVVGDLAESWDVSKDGLVITFHLRKGVRWHDGRPFTAAGRPLHLPGHGRPEDAHGLCGRLPQGEEGRGPRRSHLPGDLRQTLRPRPDELVGRHPAEAPPGREGHHDLPARPAPDRHGAVQIQRSG